MSFSNMFIIALIYKMCHLPQEPFTLPALALYALNFIVGIIYLFTPVIPAVKFMLNFKKEIVNDLIYKIDNDEQNIEKLMPCSLKELDYSIDWLNIK